MAVVLTFHKSANQMSKSAKRPGQPLTTNVRYEEVETSYFKDKYVPKALLEAAADGEIPDVLLVTYEAG